MTDNNGYVLTPLPVAPVNETDMVLLPKGLNALKQVAKEVGLDLRGAYVNLDGGFDSRANRKAIFNAGMIPNIKENPRNRKRPKRGRKRLFNAAIQYRNGIGTETTHGRVGTQGMTHATRWAAVWAIRRAAHEGQNPRRLQLKGSSSSFGHVSQPRRRKPWARIPHRK